MLIVSVNELGSSALRIGGRGSKMVTTRPRQNNPQVQPVTSLLLLRAARVPAASATPISIHRQVVVLIPPPLLHHPLPLTPSNSLSQLLAVTSLFQNSFPHPHYNSSFLRIPLISLNQTSFLILVCVCASVSVVSWDRKQAPDTQYIVCAPHLPSTDLCCAVTPRSCLTSFLVKTCWYTGQRKVKFI